MEKNEERGDKYMQKLMYILIITNMLQNILTTDSNAMSSFSFGII